MNSCWFYLDKGDPEKRVPQQEHKGDPDGTPDAAGEHRMHDAVYLGILCMHDSAGGQQHLTRVHVSAEDVHLGFGQAFGLKKADRAVLEPSFCEPWPAPVHTRSETARRTGTKSTRTRRRKSAGRRPRRRRRSTKGPRPARALLPPVALARSLTKPRTPDVRPKER